jgi:hypothetical protein
MFQSALDIYYQEKKKKKSGIQGWNSLNPQSSNPMKGAIILSLSKDLNNQIYV